MNLGEHRQPSQLVWVSALLQSLLEAPIAAEVENHYFTWVSPSVQKQLFGI